MVAYHSFFLVNIQHVIHVHGIPSPVLSLRSRRLENRAKTTRVERRGAVGRCVGAGQEAPAEKHRGLQVGWRVA